MAIKRDSKALSRIIESFNSEWQAEAQKAIDRLYQLLQDGYKVDAAVGRLAKEYPNLFTLPNLQDALVEAAAYGYGIVPEVLSEGTINDWRTRLADKWDASGMKLSEKLHGASRRMRSNIIDTLQEQMRKNKSWTDAAKALYEGYGADGDILRKQDIPEYLNAVLRATGGDKKAVRAEQKALDNIVRMAKRGAPTKALKTAYNGLLDSVKEGTEKQIANACKVAIEEKARYVAERIARTEMARAWSDGFWAQVQTDNDVVAVQFKLSTRHPFFDICDMFAKADMFGLGAGIFPKNKIPAIPVHPHCLCRYTELYEGELDMSKQREQVKEAGDKWLKSLSELRRMQVLGVRGADDWQDGKSWQGIVHGWAGLKEADTRLRGIEFRKMANGGRKSQFIKLTDNDRQYIIKEAKAIGIESNYIGFRDYRPTGYNSEKNIIFVSSQVFPANDDSPMSRDRMSVRAVLAHEYYGHKVNRNTVIPQGHWIDEFRASYRAAQKCPNLSQEERADLLRDAIDRAKEAGIAIKLNSFMRRILYGYE